MEHLVQVFIYSHLNAQLYRAISCAGWHSTQNAEMSYWACPDKGKQWVHVSHLPGKCVAGMGCYMGFGRHTWQKNILDITSITETALGKNFLHAQVQCQ